MVASTGSEQKTTLLSAWVISSSTSLLTASSHQTVTGDHEFIPSICPSTQGGHQARSEAAIAAGTGHDEDRSMLTMLPTNGVDGEDLPEHLYHGVDYRRIESSTILKRLIPRAICRHALQQAQGTEGEGSPRASAKRQRLLHSPMVLRKYLHSCAMSRYKSSRGGQTLSEDHGAAGRVIVYKRRPSLFLARDNEDRKGSSVPSGYFDISTGCDTLTGITAAPSAATCEPRSEPVLFSAFRDQGPVYRRGQIYGHALGDTAGSQRHSNLLTTNGSFQHNGSQHSFSSVVGMEASPSLLTREEILNEEVVDPEKKPQTFELLSSIEVILAFTTIAIAPNYFRSFYELYISWNSFDFIPVYMIQSIVFGVPIVSFFLSLGYLLRSKWPGALYHVSCWFGCFSILANAAMGYDCLQAGWETFSLWGFISVSLPTTENKADADSSMETCQHLTYWNCNTHEFCVFDYIAGICAPSTLTNLFATAFYDESEPPLAWFVVSILLAIVIGFIGVRTRMLSFGPTVVFVTTFVFFVYGLLISWELYSKREWMEGSTPPHTRLTAFRGEIFFDPRLWQEVFFTLFRSLRPELMLPLGYHIQAPVNINLVAMTCCVIGLLVHLIMSFFTINLLVLIMQRNGMSMAVAQKHCIDLFMHVLPSKFSSKVRSEALAIFLFVLLLTLSFTAGIESFYALIRSILRGRQTRIFSHGILKNTTILDNVLVVTAILFIFVSPFIIPALGKADLSDGKYSFLAMAPALVVVISYTWIEERKKQYDAVGVPSVRIFAVAYWSMVIFSIIPDYVYMEEWVFSLYALMTSAFCMSCLVISLALALEYYWKNHVQSFNGYTVYVSKGGRKPSKEHAFMISTWWILFGNTEALRWVINITAGAAEWKLPFWMMLSLKYLAPLFLVHNMICSLVVYFLSLITRVHHRHAGSDGPSAELFGDLATFVTIIIALAYSFIVKLDSNHRTHNWRWHRTSLNDHMTVGVRTSPLTRRTYGFQHTTEGWWRKNILILDGNNTWTKPNDEKWLPAVRSISVA